MGLWLADKGAGFGNTLCVSHEDGAHSKGGWLGAGKAHTDFAEAKLQRRLIEGQLEDGEIDALAVVALAGASAEAMQYEEVGRAASWHCWESAAV